MQPPPYHAALVTTMMAFATISSLKGISGAVECVPCIGSFTGNGVAGRSINVSTSSSSSSSQPPYSMCPAGAALTSIGILLGETGTGVLEGISFSCSETPCAGAAYSEVYYPIGVDQAGFSTMVCPVGDTGGVSTVYGGVELTDGGEVNDTALISIECAGGVDCEGACGADTRWAV